MNCHVWKPLDDLEAPFFLYRFSDDLEDVRLIFTSGERQRYFRLKFDFIEASRFTDRRANVHLHERGVKDDWPFYTVSQSNFEAWLHQANDGILTVPGHASLTHYAFCTPFECIDILSYEPPQCEWLPTEGSTSN